MLGFHHRPFAVLTPGTGRPLTGGAKVNTAAGELPKEASCFEFGTTAGGLKTFQPSKLWFIKRRVTLS